MCALLWIVGKTERDGEKPQRKEERKEERKRKRQKDREKERRKERGVREERGARVRRPYHPFYQKHRL